MSDDARLGTGRLHREDPREGVAKQAGHFAHRLLARPAVALDPPGGDTHRRDDDDHGQDAGSGDDGSIRDRTTQGDDEDEHLPDRIEGPGEEADDVVDVVAQAADRLSGRRRKRRAQGSGGPAQHVRPEQRRDDLLGGDLDHASDDRAP